MSSIGYQQGGTLMSLGKKDPINLIITGVGGQGNILISRLIGQALVDEGYFITIGETYGATQRGGSVASHVRISKEAIYSPLTPVGCADIILGLEPLESLRILTLFGNKNSFVVTNTRPIHTMAVAIGEAEYPRLEDLKKGIAKLSHKAWYIDASKMAIAMGTPLLANVIMTGALIGTGLVPVDNKMFARQLRMNLKKEQLALNVKAFEAGVGAIRA
jgi:indolepyruvate ferredoxin oxidoreductase, beta subunit